METLDETGRGFRVPHAELRGRLVAVQVVVAAVLAACCFVSLVVVAGLATAHAEIGEMARVADANWPGIVAMLALTVALAAMTATMVRATGRAVVRARRRDRKPR
jgi:hypothetical protein